MKGYFKTKFGCLNMEELKIDLPKSLLVDSKYFRTFLFLFTSTTFGYINFSEEIKTKEFIKIGISLNDYIIVQPVFLKDYQGVNNEFKDKVNSFRKNSTKDNRKDPYDDPFLEVKKSENSTKISNEIIQKLKGNNNLYFIAIKPWGIDLYSQTNLIKSFSLSIPEFKNNVSISKTYTDDALDENISRELSETKEDIDELTTRQSLTKNIDYFECIFKKKGINSSYHESLPQYMFIIIYNCKDLFISEKFQNLLNKNDKESQNEIKDQIDKFKKEYPNKLKIMVLEILSDQFISIESLINIENNLENHGKIRLFKNFREYIVIVYKPNPKKFQRTYVHVIIKQFDKYQGFKVILDKKLFFSECATPFYDILYYYNKNSGEKKFEKKAGKYKFDQSYTRQQGKH
jgi:hypothetical protein